MPVTYLKSAPPTRASVVSAILTKSFMKSSSSTTIDVKLLSDGDWLVYLEDSNTGFVARFTSFVATKYDLIIGLAEPRLTRIGMNQTMLRQRTIFDSPKECWNLDEMIEDALESEVPQKNIHYIRDLQTDETSLPHWCSAILEVIKLQHRDLPRCPCFIRVRKPESVSIEIYPTNSNLTGQHIRWNGVEWSARGMPVCNIAEAWQEVYRSITAVSTI